MAGSFPAIFLYNFILNFKEEGLISFFDPEAGSMVVCFSFVRTVMVLSDTQINVYFTLLKQIDDRYIVKSGDFVCFYVLEFLVRTGSSV